MLNLKLTQMKRPEVLLTALLILGLSPLAEGQQWTTKQGMPGARVNHAATEFNGRIYVMGGADIGGPHLASMVEYDPQTDTWTDKAPMLTPRSNLASATVNGKIYAIGGYNLAYPGNSAPGALSQMEEYDPLTDTWVAKAPMPTSRSDMSAVGYNGLIYVVGDWPNGNGLLEIYDPQTDTWSTGPSSITGRMNGNSLVQLGGELYFVAGKVEIGAGNSTDDISNKNEAYDPIGNSWSSKQDMLQATFRGAAAVLTNKIHSFGGTVEYNPEVESDIHQVYDSNTNSWSVGLPMPTVRTYHVAVTVGNAIYVIGGLTNSGLSTNVNEVFSEEILPPCVGTEAVDFAGLNPSYTTSDTPSDLIGTPAGGVFLGPGVNGDSFNPAAAGVGTHSIMYVYLNGDNCVNSAGFCTTVTQGVGIGEGTNMTFEGVRVFPNPNHGQFSVELELTGLVSMQVFDARGRVVRTEVFQSIGAKTVRTLDLSTEAKGAYTVKVQNNGGTVTQTVVVE